MKNPTICRKRRGQSGVSLVEIMVATFIFAIAVMGTLATVSSEWILARKTQERLYVNRILESRLEEVRDMTFDAILAMPSQATFTVTPSATITGQPINPYVEDGDYAKEMNQANGFAYFNPISTDLMQVTIKVTWKAAGKTEETMTTTTYIARNGVGRQ